MSSLTWYPFPKERCLGVDQDGKFVLNGVTAFNLVSVNGLPLDIALEELRDRGWVVHWPTFIMKAMLSGWNENTIRAKILEATSMAYRMDMSHRLDELISYIKGE